MATFDYSPVAELFSTRSEAELFPARSRRLRREPVGYGRFAHAADAIRFAIEELPSEQDLSALKGKDDIVTQVVAKYSLDKAQAQRDVDALLKGRQI